MNILQMCSYITNASQLEATEESSNRKTVLMLFLPKMIMLLANLCSFQLYYIVYGN